MEFTDKQFDKLFEAYQEDEEIEVVACNGFGQEFTVIGTIATVKGDEIAELGADPNVFYGGVSDNAISLEFEDDEDAESVSAEKYRSNYATRFFTSLNHQKGLNYSEDTIYVLSNFLVKSIKILSKKEIVFKNNGEYESFKFKGQIRLYNLRQKQKEEGKLLPEDIELVKNLNKYIGKPINVNGTKGILYLVEGYSDNENIILQYAVINDLERVEFPAHSKIEENGNGVLEITTLSNNHKL